MYSFCFFNSIQKNRLIPLLIFFLSAGCEVPTNNDSENNNSDSEVGCTNTIACNYGAIDTCDYGTVCSDGTIICDDSVCSEQNNDELGNFIITYTSNYPIGGFQFNLNNATITSASGGDAEIAELNISSSTNTVLGFSLSGKTISAGAGILVYLDITGDINNACIDNVIISDPTGTALTVNHDCTTIQIP
tara:strand:+ start:4891 stop:5460 length:570 start_codon:yes stop_codon:yes gene_type:complete